MLAHKHPLERDDTIHFYPDSHTYVYKNNPVRISVTGLIKQFFPQFDADKIIRGRYEQ